MKTTLIYLAAGGSRRFGRNKLLHLWEGEPLFAPLLKRLISLVSRHAEWEILVVTRYPELKAEAETLWRRNKEKREEAEGGFRVINSPDSEKGMSETIKAALRAAPFSEAYAFFVADQPYLKEDTAERFLTEMEKLNGKEGTGLGCVCFGERTGNPVWFSGEYRDELLALTGDKGGKEVVKAHRERVCLFPVEEERELWDVDIPVK